MPPIPVQVVVAVALAVVLAVGGVIGYRQWQRVRERRERLRQVGAIAFDMLHNVLVPDGNEGQLHVDFVLLTSTGLLVLDLRDLPGMIFGSESMDEWTVMDGTRRSTFANPLGPLYDRMAAVKQAAGKLPVEGRVVFSDRGSFPKGRPPRVTMLGSLAAEFDAADRTLEPSPVAIWAEDWSALRATTQPSPLARRH